MFRIAILLIASSLLAHAQSAAFRWIRQIGGSGGQTVAGIATDPEGNIYVAGSTSSLDFPVKNAIQPHPAATGLFRVDAPGANWQNLYQGGTSGASFLIPDPHDRKTLYSVVNTDLIQSSDLGTTWTKVSTIPVTYVTGIAIDPTNSSVFYVANQGNAMMKSTDGGLTWFASNSGFPHPANSAFAARRVWIDPNNPSVLFSNGIDSDYVFMRSTDAGATWQPITDPAVAGLNDSVTFDPFTPGTVYVSGSLRTAVSTDDGVTWKRINPTVQPYWEVSMILPDPRRPGVLYASAADGIWISSDSGATWVKKVFLFASLMVADPGTGAIYTALGNHVGVTMDGFDTVTPVGPPSEVITSLAVAGGHLFIGAQGSADAYVAKLDPQGNVLWATYFGGSANDSTTAMAVDAGGGVYVTGTTQSLDFPVTPGAYRLPKPYASTGNSFVFKLNPDGALAWSLYFVGSPSSIVVDGAGRAYIAGVTGSQIPTTPGAYQPDFAGNFCGIGCLISIPPTNGFLTEFDAAGSSLVLSTHLGEQNEMASALAVLPDASLVVAGNEVLYHLNPAGSALLGKKTILADLRGLAPDGAGGLLLVGGGFQNPFAAALATTPGVFQPNPYPGLSLPGGYGNAGFGDAFVMRLDGQLNVVTATLLGGEASDIAISAAVTRDGNVAVGGSTYSDAFPTRGPVQSSFNAATGFLSELTPDFSSLLFSTYAGDNRIFYVRSVAATPDGGILFGGATGATPYFQSTAPYPGPDYQAFVVRVDPLPAPALRIDSVVNAASQIGVALSPRETIQVHGTGFGDDAALYLNGSALTLIAHDRTTLTAAVPTDFSAATAAIDVQSGGAKATIEVPGAVQSPGIFSQDGSGHGTGYILNKDGTLNSPNNPAKEGDPITVFATGVGPMTFDQGYAVTASPVDVLVDGFYSLGIAAVLGPVPGLPGDVYQISVYVPRPSDYASSNPNLTNFTMPPTVAVTLRINGIYSQAGLALNVTH